MKPTPPPGGAPPSHLVFARHGEATWTGMRYAGHSDIPLTAAGRAGAEALAAGIAAAGFLADPGAAIVASHLLRAQDTARAVAAAVGRPVETDARWAEVSFGALEGLTFEEAGARWPEIVARMAARDIAVDWPGGETWVAFRARIDAALAAVLGHPAPVLVVSHGIAIRAALASLLGVDPGDSAVLPPVHPSTAIVVRRTVGGWAIDAGGAAAGESGA